MPDENDGTVESKPSETPPTTPPTPPTQPPAPPAPPVSTSSHDGPSRSEFDGLSSAVQSLTESVSKLVDNMTPNKPDSTPLDRGPWTSWGSKQRHVTDGE